MYALSLPVASHTTHGPLKRAGRFRSGPLRLVCMLQIQITRKQELLKLMGDAASDRIFPTVSKDHQQVALICAGTLR